MWWEGSRDAGSRHPKGKSKRRGIEAARGRLCALPNVEAL